MLSTLFRQLLFAKSKAGLPAMASSAAAFFGILVATTSSTMATKVQADWWSKPKEKPVPEEPQESFHGQCYKRQLWIPRMPYPAWDHDWDGKCTPQTTLKGIISSGASNTVRGTTRHIILIRHGQYDEHPEDDCERHLTPLGREQAELTGKRLASMLSEGPQSPFPSYFQGPCKIRNIYVSEMTRARETAEIIAKYLPEATRQLPDPVLNERFPGPILPVRPELDITDLDIQENREVLEEAFRKYVYRGEPAPDNDFNAHEFELIVCHGNLIRYVFCRALQLPPEAWLRLSIFNCSMTYLIVKPNGYVTARMLGDIGHLPYEKTSFSGFRGFIWS